MPTKTYFTTPPTKPQTTDLTEKEAYPINSQDWKIARGKRGRSSPDEQNFTKKRQTYIQDYWLNKPIETQNAFTILQPASDESNIQDTSTNNKVTPLKSPPIYVSGVEDIRPLKGMLNKIAENNYTLKLLSNNEVKIQPNTSEKYLPIIEELKKKNTEFHTYQRKQDKTYKTVLRNMHPSVDVEELKKEIEGKNHKVTRITNITNKISQKPLPLFFIELESSENNKEIYGINHLLNTIVSFEPPRKKRDIPQCVRCQGFGHTKNYCHKTPVCVKCAENHITKDCPIKTKVQEVKCANCAGNHPASYKGCTVRKQLQQKLYPALRDKKLNQYPTQELNLAQSNRTKTNISYAQATRDNTHQTETEINQNKTTTQTITPNINKLEAMMTQLITRMDTILNLLTSLLSKIQQQ